MEYVCRIGTPTGEVVEETFNASDPSALRAELEQKGFYVFSLRRTLNLKGLGLRRARVPSDLLLVFAQELAALLKAGLPLVQSLEIMLERQRHPVFQRSLTVISEKVRSGLALSDAFRAEGQIYPPILSASLIAGERSGNLEGVLRRFATYLRLTQGLKKKAISAAVYPAALFFMMIGLGVIMVVFVIPSFQSFYAEFSGQLPLVTRVLMAFSVAVRHNLLWIVIVVTALVLFAISWMRRESSGAVLDRWLMKVPLVGPLISMYATSQLSRTLASLLAGGLPLLNAMEVAAASISNRAMAAAVGQAVPQIREGQSLTTALESTHMVENLAIEMVKVGEQTGALADMLTAVADFYDEELGGRVATVMALAEPIVLVVMAVVVAGMLLAFYLPLFEAISSIQH
jgi:type IV pilus assembly protein PilC